MKSKYRNQRRNPLEELDLKMKTAQRRYDEALKLGAMANSKKVV